MQPLAHRDNIETLIRFLWSVSETNFLGENVPITWCTFSSGKKAIVEPFHVTLSVIKIGQSQVRKDAKDGRGC